MRALTLSIPRNTLTLQTVGRVINTGYPWLVTRLETNTRLSPCKMSRPAMVIAATMGYPWLDLFHHFSQAGTHPPHADQNNDIAGGTSESHCGVPTVGLTDTPQNDNGTLSHADLGSKELVAVPHPHETEALTPGSINASAQCSTHEHAPAEAVQSHPNDNCNKVNPSCSYADSLRPPVSGENDASP